MIWTFIKANIFLLFNSTFLTSLLHNKHLNTYLLKGWLSSKFIFFMKLWKQFIKCIRETYFILIWNRIIFWLAKTTFSLLISGQHKKLQKTVAIFLIWVFHNILKLQQYLILHRSIRVLSTISVKAWLYAKSMICIHLVVYCSIYLQANIQGVHHMSSQQLSKKSKTNMDYW